MLLVQLVGILVGLFGVGYLLVARNPVENRNVLLLGFWSKALGSLLGIGYVAAGQAAAGVSGACCSSPTSSTCRRFS